MAELNIIITAQNQAKRVLNGLKKQIKGLGSASNFANKGFSGLQNAMKIGLVGAAATAGAALVGLGVGFKSIVSMGSDAQEMMGKFNVVFANTGDEVAGALDSFAASVGRSKFELRGMASSFGDTLKPMGFAEDEAADLSVQLSKLAVDLGSFNNMETDEALRRLRGTLIGSHENAVEFGVIINENTLKAELLRMGVEDLTGAELEQAKVQARINLLMAGTADAQGDAERTSEGWANTIRKTISIFRDFGTELGMKVLPLITPLAQKFNDMAENVLPKVTEAFDWLIDNLDNFKVLAEDVFNAAKWLITGEGWNIDWWHDILDNINDLTGGLLGTEENVDSLANKLFSFGEATSNIHDAISGVITPIKNAIGEFVSWKDVMIALGVVAASIIIPILAGIVTSIAPIIAVAAALVGAIALLRNAWENDWGGIQTKTQAFWENTGRPIFEQLQTWAQEKLPQAIGALAEFWQEVLLPAFRKTWQFINDNIRPILTSLAKLWLAGVELQLRALWEVLEHILLPAFKAVWGFIFRTLGPVFESLTSNMSDSQGVVESITEKIEWLTGKIEGLADWISSVPDLRINFPEPPKWLTNPGSFLSENMPDLNPFNNAAGTHFFQGGMTIVGERGPEPVILPRGSRIVSNEKASREGMFGGQSQKPVNVTVYSYSPLDWEIEAQRLGQVVNRQQDLMFS